MESSFEIKFFIFFNFALKKTIISYQIFHEELVKLRKSELPFTFIDFSIICAIEAKHAKILVFYSLKKEFLTSVPPEILS